jgi:hypothetical protein
MYDYNHEPFFARDAAGNITFDAAGNQITILTWQLVSLFKSYRKQHRATSFL